MMAIIGLIPHPNRQEAVSLAISTAAWLIAEGHQAPILRADGADAEEGTAACESDQSDQTATGDAGRPVAAAPTSPGSTAAVPVSPFLISRLDMAVSLGGDGTMLRAAALVSPFGIPILGVNVGHLGFLTEVAPVELPQALKHFLAGEYRLEERMTLAVEVCRRSGGPPHTTIALNDAVLMRTSSGHTVRVAVSLSGTPFLTYAADSMIVATPTGSTAYNLSARGPVASPRTRVVIMTPVAAHMLFDRSLVLAQDEDVTFEVIGDLPAELVVDGQSLGCLTAGDLVRCRAGDHDARFVDFGGRDFHHVLKQKFGLADR